MKNRPDSRAILIGCMLDGGLDLSEKIISQLEREDFGDDYYGREFAQCFDVICNFVKEGKEFDGILIADELSKKGAKSAFSFISTCQEMVIAPSMYPAYLRKVREMRLRRELEDIVKQVDSADIEDILQKVNKLSEKLVLQDGIKQVADIMGPLIDRLEKQEGPDFNFSLRDLNTNIGGLNKGELMLVGGWTSQGKSSLLINLALDVAVRHKVLFCSSEMTEQELARRFLAYSCNIPVARIRKAEVSESEIEEMREKSNLFKEFDLYVAIVQSLGDILRATQKVGPEIVFVDHLHHLTGHGIREYDVVSDNIKGLQGMAIRHNVGMVVAAQLHRREERGKKDSIRPPRIDDLRASGQIEENAQMLILLFWEWQLSNEESGEKNIMDCRLVKNRDGAIGRFKLFWNSEICKYGDLTKKEEI